MAVLVLQSAGQALGGLFGPLGAMAGRALGSIAGNIIDQNLFGSKGRKIEGPRLDNLRVMSSSEGAAIARVWGRFRVSGELIWATDFEEVKSTSKQGGGKGGVATPTSKVTEYSYFANFAVALCEGPIDRIGRIWSDGKELDVSQYNIRLHLGDDTQQPDSLISAREGSANAPSYRGTAYVVFERLPLANFGNRLPQLSFEVFRAVEDIEPAISAMTIIPGATEFGYDPQPITRTAGWGISVAENTHTSTLNSDWSQSLNQLTGSCKNLAASSLVVAWFGDDLRCGECALRPGVESRDKNTEPDSWAVAGCDRGNAYLMSQNDGDPAYGGTPSDASLLRAIADLKQRELAVTFYPFVMMDIPANNNLPNPYDSTNGQAQYPWRGRITCDPAPGLAASPDQTAAVLTQINSFIGTASPADFTISNGQVIYSGPAEWSLRRMILHYAKLCQLAGGVEAFLIGSEMPGLTRLRGSGNNFPMVAALAALAADVALILPDTKISYAADWSEYFGYHPQDGSNDVWYHLDDLWAAPDIHFIGIDNYMPLADWRDGSNHLDAQAGAGSAYEQAYLKGNITAGEGFDWYYATASDRSLQIRTPITDGSYNKPWVFRYKDLKNWWLLPHYNRPGGVEQTTPTAWQPQSKPFWFTELGCAALDKAANQPNVFVDRKSSENALPYFSSGRRDDYAQRSFLNATISHWREAGSHNPISTIYNAPMVAYERMFLWCWDARPYPAFPQLRNVWADSVNYDLGHWLNGRLGAAPIAKLTSAILADYGFTDSVGEGLQGVVDGYLLDRVMSAREALEPLANAFNFDALESGSQIKFVHRSKEPDVIISRDQLVELKAGAELYQVKRAQETELPAALKMSYIDSAVSYRSGAVEARKLTGASARDVVWNLPVAMAQNTAQQRAEITLQDAWTARESTELSLPPSALRFEPGDVFSLQLSERISQWRIENITDSEGRKIESRATDSTIYDAPVTPSRHGNLLPTLSFGPPRFLVLDLPLLPNATTEAAPWLATSATPWPGEIAVLNGDADQGYEAASSLAVPAVIGTLEHDVAAGPLYRFDRATSLSVKLYNGSLSSVSERAVLDGANAAIIGNEKNGWEIIQFATAELTGPDTYELSILLRGQSGSEPEMQSLLAAGSRFVLLDDAVLQYPFNAAMIHEPQHMRVGPARFDVANASYMDHIFTSNGRSLRPLTSQHLRIRRDDGALLLSWLRRTRRDGDGWQLAEVPLGEDSENYRLRIRDGENIIREVDVSQNEYHYLSADQVADFGGEQNDSLDFEVAQLSPVYGAGPYTRSHVSF